MDSIKQFPEIAVGRAENLINQHFGLWTVLYRTLNGNDGRSKWVCQCSCENKTIKAVSARTLKNGTSTNCGCQRLQTIRLKAEQKIHKRDNNGHIILKHCFRCNQWLPLTQFYKNSSQRDGYAGECKKCNNYSKENRYNIYKKNAKRRNIDFNLSKEEFYNLTSQPCFYCGDLKQYNGIDRINSKQSYNLKNCVPCCTICNKMKLNYDVDFWFAHMNKILTYSKDENI